MEVYIFWVDRGSVRFTKSARDVHYVEYSTPLLNSMNGYTGQTARKLVDFAPVPDDHG